MPQASFDVVLEQPLVLSLQSASAGAHQCLDHVPGSVLLGLAASRLYAEMNATDAWTLFHSGRVRFGDALPIGPQGQATYPLPLCWHTYKGEPYRVSGMLQPTALFDPALNSADSMRQPVQVRSGYCALDGSFVEPARLQTLKTAIDPNTGMAAESQLFGYEALAPDQRFRFELHADPDVPAALWQSLLDTLAGTARLGRSRSAQFGRVSIVRNAPDQPDDNQLQSGTTSTELTLWLLSDLVLEHDGQPCLTPHPALLALPPQSRWLVERSFLRSRRFSPYNAYRRQYDAERQVISRGSVLRFIVPGLLDAATVESLQSGLGLHIESGLGRAWVNPPLLANARPAFVPAVVTKADKGSMQKSASDALAQPNTPLIAILHQRQQRRIGDKAHEQVARRLFEGLCHRVSEARRFLALPAGTAPESVPGRSQWGRLKQLASDYRGRSDALWDVLTHPDNGVLRARSGWELSYGPAPEQQLHRWLGDELTEMRRKATPIDRVIGHLAVLGLQSHWQACCEGRTAQMPQHKEHAA